MARSSILFTSTAATALKRSRTIGLIRRQLLSPDGLAVFDDYYPNDSSRGAKSLIDELLHDDRFVVRFFPMIEDGLEDLQITMVAVTRRNGIARG